MKMLKKITASLIVFAMCFTAFSTVIPQKSFALEYANTIEVEEKQIEYVGANAQEKVSDIVIAPNSEYEMPTSMSQKTNLATFLDTAKYIGTSIGANLPSSYRTIGLTVKNQQNTGECWAFVTTSMVEAYDLKHGNMHKEYSPRHIDYTCSKSFTDLSTITDPLLNRETSAEVGNYLMTAAYLSGARGPVLESSYPFENDTNKKVAYSSLKQEKQALVKDIRFFPAIYKKYVNGTVYYYKNNVLSSSSAYTDNDVKLIRQEIKEHIYENGGLGSMVFQSGFITDIYVGEGSSIANPNHAVFIVGWDDNYIASGWKNKGAYICLNSYGTGNFDNGYIYVSYDDRFIETGIIGLEDVSNYNIDHVYEHDEWGCDSVIDSSALINSQHRTFDKSEITSVNVFDKQSTGLEVLDKVGFTNWSLQKVEIYATQDFSNKGYPINFTQVKSRTGTFNQGWHVLDLDTSFNITNSKYAIAVRFIADNSENTATAAVEKYSLDESDWWGKVEGKEGETYFLDKLFASDEEKIYWQVPKSDGNYFNASVKGYTNEESEPEPPTPPEPPVSDLPEDILISDKYKIDGKYRRILRVEQLTTIGEFKNNIAINTEKYPEYADKVIDYKGTDSSLIKTGDSISIGDTVYDIAVIGDISGDGKRNIIDLAKMRSFLVGYKEYALNGIFYYAADLNDSSRVDVIDLAKLRVLLTQ